MEKILNGSVCMSLFELLRKEGSNMNESAEREKSQKDRPEA